MEYNYFDKIYDGKFKDIPKPKSEYYIGIGNNRINETKMIPFIQWKQKYLDRRIPSCLRIN